MTIHRGCCHHSVRRRTYDTLPSSRFAIPAAISYGQHQDTIQRYRQRACLLQPDHDRQHRTKTASHEWWFRTITQLANVCIDRLNPNEQRMLGENVEGYMTLRYRAPPRDTPVMLLARLAGECAAWRLQRRRKTNKRKTIASDSYPTSLPTCNVYNCLHKG